MSSNPIPDNNPCEDQTETTGDTGTEIQTETGSTTTPDISASGEIRTLLDANVSVDDNINANNQYKHAYFEGNSGNFGTNEPDIDDYFRRITGRYWAFGNSNNKIEYVHKAVDESSIPIRYEWKRSTAFATDPKTTVEFFSLTMPQNYQDLSYYSPDLGTAQEIFNKLILDIKSKLHNKEFTDHSFRVASPVQRRDIDATAPFPNLLYANVNPTYNFYIPSYEVIAAGIPESVLPNLYTFISQMLHDQNDEDATINPLFQKHVTLDGYIAIGDLKPMGTPSGTDTKMSGQYFDIYSKNYHRWNQESRSNSEIESKFKNQLVSHSNVNLLKNFNDKKELFPMFVDIKFSTDTNTDFAELLKDTEMGCVLMKEFVKGSDPSKQFREFLQTYENPDNPLVTHGSATMQPGGLNSRNVLDIGDWFENISNMTSGQEDIDDLNAVFLGDQRDTDIMSDPRYNFFRSLMTMLLNGRLSKLEKKHRRTYKDILNGKLANSETVAYRIEKKSGDTLIQNFYLPNSNEINIHNFIDTQVKYNEEYTYNIYALEAVYGTSYKAVIDGYTSYLVVYSKPSIKIVEVPYYEYTNKLLDSPPVQPNVEIIPFRGIDNRIKINLSSNTGKYDLHPIALEESEEKKNSILKLSQDRLPDEPLQYESDDHSTDFEVYRVDKHPSEYSDFKNSKIADLNADSDLATAVSMIDNILPNKKYWYIFRSIDNHNHVSYPTPVYQVEMVNSDGSIYPLISVVDFKVIDPRSTTKNLKRLMQIAPAFPQTILQTEELDMMESVDGADPSLFKLGVEGESIWEKNTFKIRLTSKKTGKKADINITFNHEHLD